MTSFCVYGVTRELFRTKAEKEAHIEMNAMAKRSSPPPSQSNLLEFFASRRDELMDKLFAESVQPKKISDWFSSPNRCREFMETFHGSARLMSIQVRVKERVDGKLKSVVKPYNG